MNSILRVESDFDFAGKFILVGRFIAVVGKFIIYICDTRDSVLACDGNTNLWLLSFLLYSTRELLLIRCSSSNSFISLFDTQRYYMCGERTFCFTLLNS